MCEVKGHKYAYCSRQHTAPHRYDCFKKKYIKLDPIKGFIWGEVVEILTDARKGDWTDKLLDNYENSKGYREAVIAEPQSKIKETELKLGDLLSDFVDGRFSRETIDKKHRQLIWEKDFH